MPPERQSPQPEADASQIFMLFTLLILMLVLFTPEFRVWMGESMGGVLAPIIGFDHRYPILTIFFAGMVMIILSTTIRHYFINWMEMARIQKMMFAFNKELREAQISRNQRRVEKLMELQPEVMRMNTQLSSSQMKPMMFTMMVAIPIFMWLHTFVRELSYPYASIPWEPYWNLEDRLLILPHWVLLYSLLTLPVNQLYMRWLKIRGLRREMGREEDHIEDNAANAIAAAENSFKILRQEGVDVVEYHEEMKESIALKTKGDYRSSIKLAEAVRKKAKDRISQMENAREHLRSLEDMQKIADPDADADRDIRSASEAFDRGDFASSIYYAKQAKRTLIENTAQKEYRETEVNRLRDIMDDERVDPSKVEACISRALQSRERDEFDEHIEQAEREIENAIRERDSLFAFRDDIIRKMTEGQFSDEFTGDIKRIDEFIEKRDLAGLKPFLDDLNTRVLRRKKNG